VGSCRRRPSGTTRHSSTRRRPWASRATPVPRRPT
jgi:hypothetical protein